MKIDTPQRLLSLFVPFLCTWLITVQPTLAQQSVIRGVVRDTAGNPITEAAVRAETNVTPRIAETETDETLGHVCGGESDIFFMYQRGQDFTVRKIACYNLYLNMGSLLHSKERLYILSYLSVCLFV